MTKRKFLAKLESALGSLKDNERNERLRYYEEMIDDMIEEGLSEEAAVERLGSVQGVAAKILNEASPDMLKKNKSLFAKVLTVIAIILAVCIAIIAIALIFFKYDVQTAVESVDRIEDRIENKFDVEDKIENSIEDKVQDGAVLGNDWTVGEDASISANEFSGISAIDIVWSCGNVTVDESEGSTVKVKAGKNEALEYRITDGVLYISNTDEYKGAKSGLNVLIPEDIMQLSKLSVVTDAGKVNVDYDRINELEIVTASGDIKLNECDAVNVNLISGTGDILINADEDDAFYMEYSSSTGDVSVSFDPGFKNESGVGRDSNAASAVYDHSFGNSNCPHISAVTSDGNIKLIDD